MRYVSEHPAIVSLLRSSRVLDREATHELLYRVKHGSEEEKRAACDLLVRSNCKFVYKLVLRFSSPGRSRADLFNIGCAGIIRAAEEYDLSSDVKFITYAVWWVRQHIVNQAYDDRLIRLPKNFWHAKKQLTARVASDDASGAETPDKVLERLSNVEEALRINVVDIDAPTSAFDERSQTLAETLADKNATSAFDDVDSALTVASLYRRVTAGIDPVDEFIFRAVTGLDTGEKMTLSDVAAALHLKFGRQMSRERVRQRLHKAQAHMQNQVKRLGIR